VTPYAAALETGLRRGLRTPGDLVVRLGFYVLVILVMRALWGAAVAAHGGSLAGYDLRALVWYFVGAQGAYLGPRSRTIEEVGDEIGSGAVAVALLRPVSPVGLRMALELGEASVRVLAACLVGSVEAALLVGGPPSALGLVLLPPVALAACLANQAAQHAFAAAAFWLDDAKSAWYLYSKLVFLLGGLLLPIEALPGALADVARALPFAAMAYAPGRIAAGDVSAGPLVSVIVWTVVLVALALAVHARGERRLQVVGG
jgi:ABC-2 type transport system permease protein